MTDSHEAHFHALPAGVDGAERLRATRRVTVVGALVNLVLSAAKIAAGVVGHSQALVADGVHSLSDLLTDVMVLVASQHGSREADEEHPYGHGRIETAMTVGLGLVLLAVAVGIGWDAVRRLFHPEALLVPGTVALVAAAASVLAKEALYWYTLAVARRIRSNLLRANAWHHRSDAASSIVVIVGIAGTMAGLPYLDAIAAIGVALMIAKIGWDLAWHSLRELVDTALDAETVEAIREEIARVDGVHSVHQLRTRRMGPDALVDVHVLVAPRLSVSEGHHISESVRFHLVRRFDEVQDVLVHIDPEDDEKAPPSIDLAPRRAILAALSPHWLAALPPGVAPQRIELHYLDGRVHVELYLPLAVLGHGEGDTMRAALTASAEAHPDVAEVTTYFA
jgi:cation diffusion facilitator family transporter